MNNTKDRKPQTVEANSSKLTTQQVHEIRAFARAGFTIKSIADIYSVTARTISNIVKYAASWQWLAVQSVDLPIIAPATASRLKLKKERRLSAAARQALSEYRKHLTGHIESSAEREGLAIQLMDDWRPRVGRHRRVVSHQEQVDFGTKLAPTGPMVAAVGGEII